MNNDTHRMDSNRRRETRGNTQIDEGCRKLTPALPATDATEPVFHTLDNRPGPLVSGGVKSKRLAERKNNASMET
jgi:hypothetical protein